MEVTTQSPAGGVETWFIPPVLDTVLSQGVREPAGLRLTSFTCVVLEYPPNFRLTDTGRKNHQSRKGQAPSDILPGQSGANRESVALINIKGCGQA